MGTDFMLENHNTDEFSQHVVFQIEKCQNNSINLNNRCHPDEKIEGFLKDITVEGWSIKNNLDFSIFGRQPIFKDMEIEFESSLSVLNGGHFEQSIIISKT